MNENFYDGITGMYLYFSELYYALKEPQFKEAYQLAEKLVLKLEEDYVDSVSAFYGSFAAVYPLLYTYRMTKEEQLLQAAESIAEKYMTNYDPETIESYDWNGGTASIIKVFVLLYQETGQRRYYDFAKRLLFDLDLNKVTQGGFAHGYSGVIHAANSLLTVTDDLEVELIIKKCLIKERTTFDPKQKGWLDLRPVPPMVNDLWCYGSTGIGLAYLDLLNTGFTDSKLQSEVQLAADRLLAQDKRDDCLCHGNLGDLAFLNAFGETTFATAEQKAKIKEKQEKIKTKIMNQAYTFEGLPTIPKYGLFTGLSGIGHQILRMHTPETTADVLTLTLPKK